MRYLDAMCRKLGPKETLYPYIFPLRRPERKPKDNLFVSLHGHPRTSYPYFCGFDDERGTGAGEGFNLNIPLKEDVDDAKYQAALARGLKVIRKFDPDYLVVSLGFDIIQGDPTGGFQVTPGGMRAIGAAIGGLGRPSLFVQEGGYALRNLRRGARAFFEGFNSASRVKS